MTIINKYVRKIVPNLNEEIKEINQFRFSANHTITELYKADNYTDRLNAIIKRLECFLYFEGELKKEGFDITNSRIYADTVINISTELQFLKLTNNALEDEINKTEDFNIIISGRMIDLNEEIKKIIKEAEKIFTS